MTNFIDDMRNFLSAGFSSVKILQNSKLNTVYTGDPYETGINDTDPVGLKWAPNAINFTRSLGRWGGVGKSPFSLPGASFSRPTPAYGISPVGALVTFASGQPRLSTTGLLLESQTLTNKVLAYNADPSISLTGWNPEVGTVSAVTDPLSPTGKAVLWDSTSGNLNIGGTVGNMNVHTFSAYVRSTISFSIGRSSGSSTGKTGYVASTVYQRVSHMTAGSNTGNTLQFRAGVGQLWIILVQLEDTTSISSPIVTLGSSAVRNADVASITVPFGCTTYSAVYGNSLQVVSGPVISGQTFDLVTGRPWLGLGNELKTLIME